MKMLSYTNHSIELLKIFTPSFRSIAALLLSGITISANAQVCNGSLGDPVINQTFGTKSYRLPMGHTTYQLVGGCPNTQGTYTLSSFLFGCGPRSWVQMVGDHTPDDSEGNYMLVNASNTPGTVYIDTAKKLCPNTVYQFEMWATSVMTKFACDGTAVLPNIHYTLKTLSGGILAEDSTGKLPIVDERLWRPFGLSIITPANITEVIISITVNPSYGCGAAFAIDDVTLRPCSPSVISATINGTAGPMDVCADYTDTWILNANYTPGFANPVFQWQSSNDSGKTWTDIPGETMLSYTAPHRLSGSVYYRVCIAEQGNINSASCRITSNVIKTGVHDLPLPVPPLNVRGCIGKNFFFPPSDPKALEVEWSGPNSYTSTATTATIPNVQYTDTGLYRSKLTFYYGCILYDTFYLKVFPGTTVAVQPPEPLCEGQSEILFASATDSVGYRWTPSTGLSNATIANPIASPRDSTEYKIVTTNKYGCQDSATVQVDVYHKPLANAGTDISMLIGDTAVLNGSVRGTAINYYWTPSVGINNSVLNPDVSPSQTTIYTLHVESGVGCGNAIDDVQVKIFNEFYVPNAFTPNNDGKNDKFQVEALENYKLNELLIFNRWGQIVYRSSGSFSGWDGTLHGMQQPAGVYVYELKMENTKGRKIFRKGTIVLIR